MEENINTDFICSLLELTFLAAKEQDRIDAEEKLLKLSFKSKEFFEILQKILISSAPQLNSKYYLSFSIYFYMKKVIKSSFVFIVS